MIDPGERARRNKQLKIDNTFRFYGAERGKNESQKLEKPTKEKGWFDRVRDLLNRYFVRLVNH